jgi:FAD/FMN-containing dehydrogenase
MADNDASLIGRLAAIVGGANVLTDPADIEPHLVDWRGRYRGAARAVVRPGTTDEVAAVVRVCAVESVPIVPQGGNTGMVGGATPDVSGRSIVLSLVRMNRVRDADVANATITVEAGMPLARLQQAAADVGLFFPLSLAAEGSATIGGNLATNAGGTAVLRFGNARDLVLGLEVVLADGRVWNGLRGLRKDNTGYDLKQLFVGSEGTLGIVTAAVLKLFPAPRARATALAAVRDARGAVALLGTLKSALGDRLVGFELISRFCVTLTRAHFPALPDALPGQPWVVLVQADDSAADTPVAAQLEAALGRAADQGVVADAVIAQTEGQAQALWTLRESIPEAQQLEGPNIKHDISLPVSGIPDFLDQAEAELAHALPGVRFVVFGHLGDGNLHYNLTGPEGLPAADFLAHTTQANAIVYALVDRHRGSISAEHGIGQLKRDALRRFKSPLEVELMARIKNALDPQGILNPGKVL